MKLNIASLDQDDYIFSCETYDSQIASLENKLTAVESILSLLKHTGKTDTVDKYLVNTFTGMESIGIESMSAEALSSLLTNLQDNLNTQLNIAYEGWLNNVIQKIKHTFTPDSKCATIIKSGVEKLQKADAETFENKTISYKLLPISYMTVHIKALATIFSMLSKHAEDLLKSAKLFGMNKDNKQILLNSINRVRKQMNDDLSVKLSAASLHEKNVKGQTYKAADYTKARTLGLLKEYASSCAGLLKQLKALESLLWSAGSHIASIVSTGDSIVIVREIRSAYRQLYAYCSIARDVYARADYLLYRIVKDID